MKKSILIIGKPAFQKRIILFLLCFFCELSGASGVKSTLVNIKVDRSDAKGIDPTKLPTLYPGESDEVRVEFKNDGSHDFLVTWEALTISPYIVLVNNTCSNRYLRPGEECSVDIVFSPQELGIHESEYRLKMTGENPDGSPNITFENYKIIGHVKAYSEPPKGCEMTSSGSIIGIDTLSVGEKIPLAGMPYHLFYSTRRSASFKNGLMTPVRYPSLDPEGWSFEILHYLDINNGKMYTGKGSLFPVTFTDLGDGYKSVLHNGELYVFDLTGKHIKTQSELTGFTKFTMTYGAEGKVSKITDSFGNEIIFNRNSLGQLTKIISPYGYETNVILNSNGFVQQVLNPLNESTSIEYYPSSDLMKRFVLPGGKVSDFTYTPLGRLVSDKNNLGMSSVFQLNKNSGITTQTSSMGRVTQYRAFRNTEDSYIAIKTSSLGNTYISAIDDDYVSGSSDDFYFNENINIDDIRFGTLKQVPLVERYGFLGKEKIVKNYSYETIPSSVNTPFSFEKIIYRTHVVLKNINLFMTSSFDRLTKKFTIEDTSSVVRKVQIDEFERVVSHQYANDNPWQIFYNQRGEISEVKQGSSKGYNFTYNTLGHVTKMTDLLGREHNYSYDITGRVTQQIFPDGRLVIFGYNSDGKITSVTPPGRDPHLLRLDFDGKLSEYKPPLLGGYEYSTKYYYNLDMQLESISRAQSHDIVFDYEENGRLRGIKAEGLEQGYTYVPKTEVPKQIESFDGIRTSYEYGDFFSINSVDQKAINWWHRISWNRDGLGRPQNRFTSAQFSHNPVSVNYSYDKLNLSALGPMNFKYNNISRRVEETSIENIRDYYIYDSNGDLFSYQAKYIDAQNVEKILYSYTLNRNIMGLVVGKTESLLQDANTYIYEYDTSSRLIGVIKNGMQQGMYNYDFNGNRISGSIGNAPFVASFDSQDRILNFSNITYRHHPNGEMVERSRGALPSDHFKYNALGQMKSIHLSTGKTVDYELDSNGNRVFVKIDQESVFQNIYEANDRIAVQFDHKTKTVKEFFYSSDISSPEIMRYKDQYYRFIKDHLGSPRLVVNTKTGQIAQRMDYDVWGRVIENTNIGFQPYGFAGGLYDDVSQLVKFGARDYDPEVGRWTSKDPILFGGGDINLYGYVFNDPVNFIDDNGLSAKDVSRIKGVFKETISSMTNKLQRTDPGALNNFLRSLQNIAGTQNKFLGCGEQADYMTGVLEQQKYDDTWTFSPVDQVIHHLIEAKSSNPSDPVLRIDPWRNIIYEK